MAGRRVRPRYAGLDEPVSERLVDPLGPVAKGEGWYLVAGTGGGLRTFRVGRVQAVTVTEDPVRRPEGFDLARTWSGVLAELDRRRLPARSTLRVDAGALDPLGGLFGTRMATGGAGADGRVDVEVRVPSDELLAAQLAGFGRLVELVDAYGPAGVSAAAT